MTTQKFNTLDIDDSPFYQNVIKSYHRAIEILQDASYVQNYLSVTSYIEHEEILQLRLYIDWFDCAISMLQEEEIFYLEEVKQKAIYYLNRYYRPQIKSDLNEDPNWRWLMQQDNQITKSFFQTYSNGIIPLYPIKQGAAAGLYQMGSNYAELLLPIPAPQGEVEDNFPLKLSIAFRWTDEKMWGEISIRVNSEKILSKTQKHFLTLFRVDLKYSPNLEKNLVVNAYGKFFVSNDFAKMNIIKEFLNSKKLLCTLKLNAQRYCTTMLTLVLESKNMSWEIFFELEAEAKKSQCFAFLHKKIVHNFYNKKIAREDAEDLAQDVCVRVMQNLDSILSKCENVLHLKNYIYKLAKNILFDHIQKQKKSLSSIAIEEICVETPEGVILEKELNYILYGCMEKINENWCEILIWKDVQGKTANEILLLSGVSERTQRLWRSKAKDQLKTCIENKLQNE